MAFTRKIASISYTSGLIFMSRVIHFEIAANDPEKVVAFYKKTFDWVITKWDGPTEYWLVMTGDRAKPGIDGGITQRRSAVADIVNTIDVPSFDEALKKVLANGGKAITPKTEVPGVGFMCYCEDIEGNKFGIMESFPNQVMVDSKPGAKSVAKPSKKSETMVKPPSKKKK